MPDQIPEYNGTYEDFGQNHLYYPNGGEIRFADADQSDTRDVVAFYTKYTFPQKYILRNNNMSFVFGRRDTVNGSPRDSLHRIDMKMERGSTSAYPARIDTQNTCVLNYLTHWFGSSGRTDVKGGSAIAVQNIYSNIDMIYFSNNAGVKIYYVIYPGGDPNQIVFKFDGAKNTSISGNDLVIEANWDKMKFVKPKMYQYTYAGNVITPVNVCPASWQSLGSDRYKISTTSSWSSSLPLIVQVSQGPAIQASLNGINWSTYFGSVQWDFLHRTHTDASNNLYVGGQTASPNFPGLSGAVIQQVISNVDGFISKFDALGQLKWSTYFGGSNDEDLLDFDFSGTDIYCVGNTGSSNMPIQAKTLSGTFNDNTFGGGIYDGFILQISPAGLTGIQNSWSTYFGGNGEDILQACKFDFSGNLFVVGSSASTDLSTVGSGGMYTQSFNSSQLAQSGLPVTDAIISKFNAGTSAQSWFTFYGTNVLGTNAYGYAGDYFYSLCIYGTDLIACGKSGGTNLPGTINNKFVNANFDGILTNFSTGGVLGNAKYTDGNICNYSVKANSALVYAAGYANSVMTPTNSGNYYYDGTCLSGDNDGCFSVHTLNLTTTVHNSFLGGSSNETACDLVFANNDVFYIAGATWSNDFPTTSLGSMWQNGLSGNIDNFVASFKYGTPNMIWGSYLGSPDMESYFPPNLGGTSIALNNSNILFLGGMSAALNTFPLDNGGGIPYFQGQNNSPNLGETGTVTRFDMTAMNTWVGLADFGNTDFTFGYYPNPTVNYLTIDNPSLAGQDLRYAVYDLGGKKLAEGQLPAGNARQVDVSQLPQGVFIINVSNGTRTFSNKFIKDEN